MKIKTDKQKAKQLQPFHFKKGVSGNPKGRPKKDRCIPDILKKITDEQIAGDESKLYQILNEVVNRALAGDNWCIQFIADRMEGRPSQVVQNQSEELPSGFTTTII